MARTITGGCLCGAVRYAYAGDLGPAGYCHCEDCRRVTGSAFNVSVRVARVQLELRGDVRAFTKTADSGTAITRWFCPVCGSPLYTSSPRHPDDAYLKAGSLDDPSVVQPASVAWTDRAVGWSVIDPALPRFPRGRS